MEQPSAPSGHRGMEYQAKAVGRPDGRSLGTPPTPAELFVAEMVADLAVGDTPSTKRMTRVLQRLVDWSLAEGMALDRDLILDPDTVDRFVEVALGADRSQATYRSVLRKVGPELTVTAPWPPRPVAVPRRALASPYSADEVALLVGDASNQPTAHRRRAARALLALGLGAGLDGRWLTRVTARDVHRRGDSIVVMAGEPMARAVVLLARWEEDVRHLAETAGTEFLVGGSSTSRNRTGHLVASLEVPTGHPSIAPARLRSTWLLWHLQAGTRLPELCRAAGIKGPAVLSELLGLVSPLAAQDVDAMLRGQR